MHGWGVGRERDYRGLLNLAVSNKSHVGFFGLWGAPAKCRTALGLRQGFIESAHAHPLHPPRCGGV